MQIKSSFMDSSKSNQSNFAKSPKVLDAVDMILHFTAKLPLCKFIFSMPNSVMFFISKISQTIVRFPRIRENYRIIPNINLLVYYRQKLICRTVFNYLGKHFAISFEHSKNWYFTTRSSASFAFDSFATKIRFIYLNLAKSKWVFSFAEFCNSYTNSFEYFVLYFLN